MDSQCKGSEEESTSWIRYYSQVTSVAANCENRLAVSPLQWKCFPHSHSFDSLPPTLIAPVLIHRALANTCSLITSAQLRGSGLTNERFVFSSSSSPSSFTSNPHESRILLILFLCIFLHHHSHFVYLTSLSILPLLNRMILKEISIIQPNTMFTFDTIAPSLSQNPLRLLELEAVKNITLESLQTLFNSVTPPPRPRHFPLFLSHSFFEFHSMPFLFLVFLM